MHLQVAHVFICRQTDFNWLQSNLDLILARNKHDHYISKEVRGIYLCVFCAMNCNMCLPWDTKKTTANTH